MLNSTIILAAPLLAILALATSIDLVDRRIPNGLSIGGALVGVMTQATLWGPTGLGSSLLGWFVCLACFVPLYACRAMAAGDVKLMGMVGAFLGPLDGFTACLCTLVAGALLAAIALVCAPITRRFSDGAPIGPSGSTVAELGIQRAVHKLPYAGAIALGAAVVVIRPEWLSSLLPLEVLQ